MHSGHFQLLSERQLLRWWGHLLYAPRGWHLLLRARSQMCRSWRHDCDCTTATYVRWLGAEHLWQHLPRCRCQLLSWRKLLLRRRDLLPGSGWNTCCIPGMNCVALGGVTVAAVPTAQETQTVASIAVVTSTAPTTSTATTTEITTAPTTSTATTTEINIVTYTASATMASSSSSSSTTSTVSSTAANSGPTTVTVSATSADNTVPATVTVGASAATGSSTKSYATHFWIDDNPFSFVSWLNVCTMFVILKLLLC